MISSKLFRKQFIIAAGSIFVCIFLGTLLLSLVLRLSLPPPDQAKIQAPRLFQNLVEREGNGDLVLGMKRTEILMGKDEPLSLYLLDEKGNPLYPSSAPIPKGMKLPATVNESLAAVPNDMGSPALGTVITRLNHVPPRYLLVEMHPIGFPGGHGPPSPPGGPYFFPFSFLLMAFMVLMGIGIALWIIFRSLRATAQQADDVISELKRGNLKARFPIHRNDEIGQAMKRFNSMADEIESLVERLRAAESSRNNLLQELTHDLRTPVASLKTMLEGIFQSVELAGDVLEMSELSLNEVDYLERLVEDLLLLARLTEPRYKASKGLVDFLSLLEQESDTLAYKHEGRVRIVTHLNVDEALILGDEHLFQRLVRNTLDNAFAYAKSKVEVELNCAANGSIQVRVTDDGEGISPEDLSKFGERREQRTVKRKKGGKLSLGLGSVIMKSVVSLHGGKLSVGNSPSGGAVVEFTLPNGS
ncbi:MAG: ATP-binding protein [Bdellovibrionota bacterium]